MLRRRYISVLGTTVLAGCGSNGVSNETSEPAETAENTATGAPAVDTVTDSRSRSTPGSIEPSRHDLSGTGDDTVEGVELAGGLTIVEGSHTGEGTFFVEMVNDGRGATVVSEKNDWQGATAQRQGEAAYTVRVTAGGQWDLTLRQPRPQSGTPVPSSVTGSGQAVRGPFEFGRETFTVTGTHDSDERLVAYVYNRDGLGWQLYETYGGQSADETTYDSATDIGWVDVDAVGDWTIEFEST